MYNPVYKLLIVEDDLGIAQAIQTQASMWNFDVRIVENFRDVTGEVTSFSPHIILLDITLPFFNGYHWCSEIRKFSRVPIIFILICYLSNYMARITSCNNMAWNVFYHN